MPFLIFAPHSKENTVSIQKVAALDLGDQWTGIAISDAMLYCAMPLTTVETKNLETFLSDLIQKQFIKTILVGVPFTLRGTESEQTKKVRAQIEQLKRKFPDMDWKEVDERFSSKQATSLQKQYHKASSIAQIKEEKLKNHAIAAACMLESYLQTLMVE